MKKSSVNEGRKKKYFIKTKKFIPIGHEIKLKITKIKHDIHSRLNR